ncbi:MAG: radical SAM protein [Clostridia bacterium]|nr:radical SAM protein [Clostridia bacterium]
MVKSTEDAMNKNEFYKSCSLCPRACGVNRTSGQKGACGMSAALLVSRAALHMWEEPPISGKQGSGTVFFAGCPLSCVFCQNAEISHMGHGKEISISRLVEIFLELQEKGAHNINLVTATHFVPHVIAALDTAKARGLNIPILYNCGGYESAETLRMLRGYIDIYLPDFKYMSPELAARYSLCRDYPERAKEALAEMVAQTGAPVFDENGMMKRGTVVRHLVLPGCARDSIEVVRYLHETYGDKIYISIMSQYTPSERLRERFPELARKLTRYEYQKVVRFASEKGVKNGFTQYGEAAAESFIPRFDFEGV